MNRRRWQIRSPLRSLSLGSRWFVGSAVLLLVAFVPFGIYQAEIVRGHLEDRVRGQLRAQANAVHDLVGQRLRMQRHMIWGVGEVARRRLVTNGFEGVKELLQEVHRREERFSALFLLSREGRVLVAEPAVRYTGDEAVGLSYADRGYFQAAVKSKDVEVGNVVMGRTTGEPTLGFGYALRDEAEGFTYVLTAGLYLIEFQHWLERKVHEPGTEVVILDNQLRVIASRVAGQVSTFEDVSHVALYRMRGETAVGYNHLGERVIAIMSTVPELGWRVVVMSTQASVEAAVRQTFSHTGVVGTVAILAAMLLSVFVARSVSLPTRQLMEGIDVVSQGDLEHTVEVSSGPEFERMAAAFNNMTRAVAERNRQLEEAKAVLQEALAQAEEANRHKSEFLANVSHELRTPLNAIVNIPAGLLQEYDTRLLWVCSNCGGRQEAQPDAVVKRCADCDGQGLQEVEQVVLTGDPQEHQHFLRRLEQSSKHLLHVVNDLLDFSKIEAGYMELCCMPIELDELVAEVVMPMAELAHSRGVTLEQRLHPPAEVVEVDGLRVQQVLYNLVGNALKFTDPGGVVCLQVRPEAHQGSMGLRFEVQDNGIGIPEDKLALVFESFRQVDGSHTRRRGGTGLGLAISKRLVELHGGFIGVVSSLGEGSTFYFWVPLKPPS